MAFDAFNEESGNFGGGNYAPTILGLYRAFDYEAFCRDVRDNVHSLPHDKEFGPYQLVCPTTFDPLTYQPPSPCEMIGHWEGEDFKGYYGYGELLKWRDGVARMDKIARAYKITPPILEPELGFIVQSQDGRFLSLPHETVAVIGTNAAGQRHYVWSVSDHPKRQIPPRHNY